MTFLQFCESVSDSPLKEFQKDYLLNLYHLKNIYPEDFESLCICISRRAITSAKLTLGLLLLKEFEDHKYEGV